MVKDCFILLLVCLYLLSVISGWVWVILSDFSMYQEIEKSLKITWTHPEITLNEYRQTRGKIKQELLVRISFIFKFPTDWGGDQQAF